MNQTVLTSQGTITLPIALRRRHNLRPGDVLTIEDDDGIRIVKNKELGELRAKNRAYLKNAPKKYKQGDGWAAHIMEKYGAK